MVTETVERKTMEKNLPIPAKETGETTVSINNILNLTTSHGIVVGAIHRISPRLDEDQNKYSLLESTVFFFSDGYVHTSKGFGVGEMSEKTSGLKWILQTIPGVGCKIEGNFLVNISTNEETTEVLQSGSAMHYVFRAPADNIKATEFLSLKNNGMTVMEKAIQELACDDLCELEESW